MYKRKYVCMIHQDEFATFSFKSSFSSFSGSARVAQLVERQAFNLNVQGSSPCSGESFFLLFVIPVWTMYAYLTCRIWRGTYYLDALPFTFLLLIYFEI